MIRYLPLFVFCFLVFACSSVPPVEVELDHGAGVVLRHSPDLDAIVPSDYTIEKLDDGFGFVEGPVWVKDPGYLLFSDVRGDTIFKWAPGTKSEPFLTPVYAGPSLDEPGAIGPNGLTVDGKGHLYILEYGNRRVTRMPLEGGEREILADRFEGKRFNHPNDLVLHSSGAIYFTDPPLGRGEEKAPEQELDFAGVYRLDPDGQLTLLTTELKRPNGIALSSDEKTLYVANTNRERLIWMAWDVQPDGSIANERVFFDVTGREGPGAPDGMKLDSQGNLYCTGPGGVLIFTPDGEHLGTIQPTEQPSNVAWGDADGKTLYMTARTGLYRIRLNVQGLLPVSVK